MVLDIAMASNALRDIQVVVLLVLGSGALVWREWMVSLVVMRDELLDLVLSVAVLPFALMLLAMAAPVSPVGDLVPRRGVR